MSDLKYFWRPNRSHFKRMDQRFRFTRSVALMKYFTGRECCPLHAAVAAAAPLTSVNCRPSLRRPLFGDRYVAICENWELNMAVVSAATLNIYSHFFSPPSPSPVCKWNDLKSAICWRFLLLKSDALWQIKFARISVSTWRCRIAFLQVESRVRSSRLYASIIRQFR